MKISDKINLSNKRGADETFAAYKKRLKVNKKILKRYLAGFVVWQPNFDIGNGRIAGPYIKDLHGPINLNHNLDVFLNKIKVEDSDNQEEE